ncbi:MAG: rod shape-determining protein MreD [Desulfomonilaceae bacterium]
MKELIFLTIFSLPTLLLQTTIIPLLVNSQYKPDLFLILVFWAAIRITFVSAAVFAFTAGLLTDLFSGAPPGLFAILYLLIFLSCAYLHSVFQLDSHAVNAMTVFCASFVAGHMIIAVTWLKVPVEFGWNLFQWPFLKSLSTALFAVMVVPALDWFWNSYSKLVPAR